MHVVNLPHDSLCPLNRSGYERLRPWAGAAVKQIVRGLQVTRHEDSRHNRQHAFAALVHAESLSDLLFVRPVDTGNVRFCPTVPYRFWG